MARIADLRAREVLDSRGNPTVEVDCLLDDGTVGTAPVPSGASTGSAEALELRDGDSSRFLGKGVLRACDNVRDTIKPRLVGMDAFAQQRVDDALVELDGTANKSRLGANATLAVSLACCRAAAASARVPAWRLLRGHGACRLPVPMLNVVNGGAHAANTLDIQEFMVVPAGFDDFASALRCASEVYHSLKKLLAGEGLATAVGDEGGFAADFPNNEAPLRFIVQAAEAAGYRPGEQVFIALDVAATELLVDGKTYGFTVPSERRLKPDDLIDLYERWLGKYPLVSIEDGLAEDDWANWRNLTIRLADRALLIGDDIFVTSTARLARAFEQKVANAVLVKLNQIGTLSETLACIKLAREHGYRTVISHRSGETCDDFIADLAVATSARFIKTGAPCRGERVIKYNRLLRIEETAGIPYWGRAALEH